MLAGKGFDQPYRSVNEIVEHLIKIHFRLKLKFKLSF
jgi:hypothetical protein